MMMKYSIVLILVLYTVTADEELAAELLDTILDPVLGLVSIACPLLKAVLVLDKTADLSKVTFGYKNLTDFDSSIAFNLTDAAGNITAVTLANPDDSLIMLMHGFSSGANKTTFDKTIAALHEKGRFNVVSIDATELLMGINYFRAAQYVPAIGFAVGTVLADIIKNGVKASTIHVVGHSLGAHIAGIAAQVVYNQTGTSIGRITGLDPAGPCFTNVNLDMRLSATDSNFVDVIHTDAGSLGIDINLGHVDFYPNGGGSQPGCVASSCSHSRSHQLFAESITNSTGFLSVQCDSYSDFKRRRCDYDVTSYLGYFIDQDTSSGSFYLETAEASPYALGETGVRYENRAGILDTLVEGVSDTATTVVDNTRCIKYDFKIFLVILSLLSINKAQDTDIVKWLRSSTQDLGYEAFSLLLRNSPFLSSSLRQLIGEAEVDIDLETIYFVHNTTEGHSTFKYSEAANTIASIFNRNPDDKLVVVLHGFTDNVDKPTFEAVKDALYLIGEKNVFYLDCREFISKGYNYFQAMKNAQVVAESIAEMLQQITDLGISRSSITLVGQSLGAQIAGLIGQAYNRKTGQKIGRVTGLDPSGICYDHLDDTEKITSNDADFVDIWRTDIDGFGYYNQQGTEPVGDADYFANGGLYQPDSFYNSHARVLLLYAESINNPEAFLAVKCDNYDQFKAGTCSGVTRYIGFYSDATIRGNFYFQTRSTAPFALGDEGATYNKNYDV